MDTAHQNAPAEAPGFGIRQPAPDGRHASDCSAFFVQKLGRLLEMHEREWNEKEVLESVRDLLARHKHTMARCQDAAQKYRLGLGGEPVDRLVIDELHRLKQNIVEQKPKSYIPTNKLDTISIK